MNYYDEIKEKLIDNEINRKVKDYSKERYRVITHTLKWVNCLRKQDLNMVIILLKKLMAEVGKKYNKRTLFRMKQFYEVFSNEKVSPLGTQLTWSHYRAMLSIKDYNEINYYIQISINNHLSKTELEQKIQMSTKDWMKILRIN